MNGKKTCEQSGTAVGKGAWLTGCSDCWRGVSTKSSCFMLCCGFGFRAQCVGLCNNVFGSGFSVSGSGFTGSGFGV